jgi:hypothetical protein
MAVLIVTLWLAGMAALGHREIFRDNSERLVMAGLLVTPGNDFYEVTHDGEHIGFSSFTVDTSLHGLDIMEYRVVDVMRHDGSFVRVARRYRALTSPSLKLLRFQLDEQSGSNVRTVHGTIEGDSVLLLVTHAGERETRERIKLDHPLLPTSAVPLALVLSRPPRVGRVYDFATLDPVEMRPRPVRLRVTADSTMVFADSSSLHEASGRWMPARNVTVRAWKIEQEPFGPLTAWVDEQGRVMDRALESGWHEHRTAYEIAYLNWPRNRYRNAPAAAATDTNETTPR